MRYFWLILMLLATPCLGAATTRPSAAIDPASCVTADCHAGIKASPSLHGPAANNSCEACHELMDVAKHEYRIMRQGADLCTYCHEFDVAAMPVVHKPVTLGQCTGCHDPHGGRDRTLTREDSMLQLCYRCHENAPSDHKVLHTPVAQGQCTSCHPPHGAMFPKLLDAVGSDLCLACHDQLDQRLGEVRVRHKALDKGCDQCHDAHGSDEPMQLTKATQSLCEGCHEKVKDRIATATHRHSAVSTGKACMTCHTPHGADAVSLLIDQPRNLCMECHDEPIRMAGDGGRTIPAMTELAGEGLHLHGAIKDGQCSGCHEAHGTAEPMLLTKSYSTVIYQPFSLEQYELCFSCHDQRLVTSAISETVTNFRNGDRNLHAVHIKQGKRERSCAMCHTTHASINERNIRQTVPFKAWDMPIRFSKTDTGGSCAPGCHVPWDYDRQKSVAGPTSLPADERDFPPPQRPTKQAAPVLVRLNTRDTQGRDVRIPNAPPSVIVFVRDDPEQISAVLKQIESTVQEKAVQVIAVISGPSAGLVVPATSNAQWAVIADPDGQLASQLQVHGWPMAMVVQADGLKVAGFGGSIQSMSLKLQPYLDLAARTLDQAAVDRILTHPIIATDGGRTAPGQDLYLARKLLTENQPTDALRLIEQAMAREPDSIPLKLESVNALLALNRTDEALSRVETIPSTRLPPGTVDVVRAKALLARYRWLDAKNLLTELVQKYPSLSEAHYLLGTLYERDQEWQKAAEHYRAAGAAQARPSGR